MKIFDCILWKCKYVRIFPAIKISNKIQPDYRTPQRFEYFFTNLHWSYIPAGLIWFLLFNVISAVVGYLMPKPSL